MYTASAKSRHNIASPETTALISYYKENSEEITKYIEATKDLIESVNKIGMYITGNPFSILYDNSRIADLYNHFRKNPNKETANILLSYYADNSAKIEEFSQEKAKILQSAIDMQSKVKDQPEIRFFQKEERLPIDAQFIQAQKGI